MTVAVCIYCGEMKFGAILPCERCGRSPQSPQEFAKSIILSDHYLSEQGMEVVGEMVKRGKEPLQVQTIREIYEEFLPTVMGKDGEFDFTPLHDWLCGESVCLNKLASVQRKNDIERKPCPFCGELIALGASKCRFCKEWLESEDIPEKAMTNESIMTVINILTPVNDVATLRE